VDLSSRESSALLTTACRLVLDAQQNGDCVVWISLAGSTWFAPDVADLGIDLDALIVVRVDGVPQAARAADEIARSNAFGLLVLDLGGDRSGDRLPAAALTRLSGLALNQDLAIVFLTSKPADAPSISALISLRGDTGLVRCGAGEYRTVIRVVKDKRDGPGAVHEEVCRAPAGVS
jgi:recombination protein RecA